MQAAKFGISDGERLHGGAKKPTTEPEILGRAWVTLLIARADRRFLSNGGPAGESPEIVVLCNWLKSRGKSYQ
jgi:hypothetical protein